MDGTELARLADDGCPHTEDTAGASSRALAAYVTRVVQRMPHNDKRSALDTRKHYAALGALLVEVAPGVYVESHRNPVLWSQENCDGYTLLYLCVDKRGK